MCGICGIVDYSSTADDFVRRLGGMVATLRHRGPDQSGTWADDRAGLGHARLSIIDLSDGRQPLSNEDRTVWITFNGEIYNFPELRRELEGKGHRFATRTDTETIVHLYEQEGIDGVERLRGMFSIGIWDARSQTAYLVRDRIGIKPLYYTVFNGRLIFGSEIKAILAHGGLPRAVREDALSDYLTFLYVPAPKTMFRDIFKLEPGHWLRFDRNGVFKRQYWDLTPQAELDAPTERVEGELIENLSDAVGSHLISDVPLGAFLSGGVDSSAVVAMMARAGCRPLITASVGFDDARYDELPYARRVAERYRTQHYEEVVRPEAAQIVETLAWHYDEPFADYSSIPTYYVSQAARRHVTVALSGDGGDENFAGYRRYRWDLRERRVRAWLPDPLRRWLVRPLASLYPQLDWLPRPLRAKATLTNIAADEAEAYTRSVSLFTEDEKLALLDAGLAEALGGYRSSDVIRDHMARSGRTGLAQLLYTDIKTYLPDDILTKVDRASMAVSLEVRVPLLDHRFVEFAARVPPAMKLRRGRGKAVFKSALRPYLDAETLDRPKQGFTPPISDWLRGPLKEMASDLLFSPGAAHAPYLDRPAIESLWRKHQSGRREYGAILWAVLTLELWARRFLQER